MSYLPEQEYLNIIDHIPLCCVDVIVVHNKKVLLIKRGQSEPKSVWWLPGGRIYKNETWEAAVKRKVKAETGFDVRIVSQSKSYEDFVKEKVPSGIHCITTVFVTVPIDTSIVVSLDETIDDYKWIE